MTHHKLLLRSASRSQNAGVENAEALPNPWGAGGAATGSAAGAPQGAQGGELGTSKETVISQPMSWV